MSGPPPQRILATRPVQFQQGRVRWAPVKSLWLITHAGLALHGALFHFSWAGLTLFLLSTGTVLLLGHSLGNHRKLIHNSFDCPRYLEYLMAWLGCQVGLAGPLGLLHQHELRDHAQRQAECHPYLRHGMSIWIDAWWQLHCELLLTHPPELRLEPQLANNTFYRTLERSWMLQAVALGLPFYAWGGWGFVVWGVCARITAAVFGHWLIGYFAHNHGEIRQVVHGAVVQGRNLRWTSLLTMGEGWHNNHHAFPGSARLGLYEGEWDPGWWCLQLLQRCGLVWDLKLPCYSLARPESHATSSGLRIQESRSS